jgi:hypothetical protein
MKDFEEKRLSEEVWLGNILVCKILKRYNYGKYSILRKHDYDKKFGFL